LTLINTREKRGVVPDKESDQGWPLQDCTLSEPPGMSSRDGDPSITFSTEDLP
jgi:hypothetical protein